MPSPYRRAAALAAIIAAGALPLALPDAASAQPNPTLENSFRKRPR